MDRERCLKYTPQLSTFCGAYNINNWKCFFNVNVSHFNNHNISYTEDQKIQPFSLKSDDSVKKQPRKNWPTAKLKHLYNYSKAYWILKYGMEKIIPHHMNSILAEVWDAFKVSAGNIISDRFLKIKVNPPSVLLVSSLTPRIFCLHPSLFWSQGWRH